MQLRKATRKQVKIKIGLQGPSGSGKTMSGLLLAHGMTGDWSKIAVIDAENGSSELYSHLGDFNVLPLEPPYTPERYIQAINACNIPEIEVIIVDSMSHEWDGKGGILDIHNGMTGNSYTNWAKLTPRHNRFIDAILQTKKHFICTMRSKQDYVLEDKNGKQVPTKVGLKAITREGVDYEFTLVFDLDIKHNAEASKDRTSLFMDQPHVTLSNEQGKALMKWANEGEEAPANNNQVQELDQTEQEKPTVPKATKEQKDKIAELLNNAALSQEEKVKGVKRIPSLTIESAVLAIDYYTKLINERKQPA